MSDFIFPSDTCVLACSGPSLNNVDVYSLGVPIVAVSTAIRKIPNPNFWVLADYLNEMHDVEGREAYSNPEIIKVIPDNKISSGANPQSLVLCNYDTSTRWPDLDKHLFNGKQPFVRGPHKSVTFGLQWLHFIGVKRIIWAGNDLTATSMRGKYCYEVKDFDMKKEYNYHKTLDQTADALKKWYPIALRKGLEWYSWNCGSVFESFVPKFDLEWWEREGKAQTNQTNFIIPKKSDRLENLVEKKINPPRKPIKPEQKIKVQKEELNIPQPEPNVIEKMEPAKEIISNRRNYRRQQIEFRKNLRSP
jgi:hypothetical protein